MSTVEDMADVPFGFSTGDDPDSDKRRENDPESGSGAADPFGLGGLGGDFNVADLGQMFTRLGQMFSGAGSMGGQSSGPVNYELARQLASSSIGFVAPIPIATREAIGDAVHLAETWLDGVTALPAGTTKAVAWTPNDWVDHTLETWKRLCDPMAQQIATVWASALPDEAKAMAGPLLSMMSQMGGMAFGSQLGQALARLAREVLTSTDVGLPLGPKGIAALLPDAIEAFADGLEQPRSEIVTFLAAREAAHHRLFSHVPWLSSQLLGAVEAYAKGMKIDINIKNVQLESTPTSKGTIGSLDATITWTADGIKDSVQTGIPVLGPFVTNSVTTHPSDGTIELKGMLDNITTKPMVSGNGLELQIVSFNALGFMLPKETVQSTLDEFTDNLTKNYPLGIHADSVQVTTTGVVSHFSTQNASIPTGDNGQDPCFSNI